MDKPKQKSIFDARTETLDADAIAAWDAPDGQRLWSLPHGVWDHDYVLRTGQGRHRMYFALDRAGARRWLDAHGFEKAQLRQPEWTTDRAGLQHWRGHVGLGGTAEDAARRCLDTLSGVLHGRRPSSPAWFWWNDTPAPIVDDDTVKALVERWLAWREETACRSCSAVALLSEWSFTRLREPDE